ncbi:MAG: hypothetical protein U0X93_18540 [Anaerolineales bacterium]
MPLPCDDRCRFGCLQVAGSRSGIDRHTVFVFVRLDAEYGRFGAGGVDAIRFFVAGGGDATDARGGGVKGAIAARVWAVSGMSRRSPLRGVQVTSDSKQLSVSVTEHPICVRISRNLATCLEFREMFFDFDRPADELAPRRESRGGGGGVHFDWVVGNW